MAAFDTTRTAYGASSAAKGFFDYVARAAGALAAWNDARITRNKLATLTDRELEDIGLVRSDIDNVTSGSFFR